MNEKELISVIVPVFNSENYLKNCIESVLNQTLSNWELLLINDGSTDSSLDICNEYSRKNSRIKVASKIQGGVSSARNFGIDISNGQYIMFLDSDDTLVDNCLEILYNEMKRSNCDIISGTSNNRILGNDCCLEGEESIKATLKDNPFTYSAWAKLYSRKIIGDTRFCESFRVNEDSFFVFEILCKKPSFKCINKSVYNYNQTPNSISRSKFTEKYFDILNVSKKKYEIIEKNYPQLLPLAENMRLKSYMNILKILALRTNGEYKIQEKEFLKEVKKNKKYYISATKSDDKWMFILKHNLFYVYKFIINLRKS